MTEAITPEVFCGKNFHRYRGPHRPPLLNIPVSLLYEWTHTFIGKTDVHQWCMIPSPAKEARYRPPYLSNLKVDLYQLYTGDHSFYYTKEGELMGELKVRLLELEEAVKCLKESYSVCAANDINPITANSVYTAAMYTENNADKLLKTFNE